MAESLHALRISPSEPYLPLRHSSAARAIAAFLPPEELAPLRVIDPSIDESTLAEVRREGWAMNDREIVGDTRVVGTAVGHVGGPPVAAVIIAAPTSRVGFEDMQRIGAHLAATVQAVTSAG